MAGGETTPPPRARGLLRSPHGRYSRDASVPGLSDVAEYWTHRSLKKEIFKPNGFYLDP